jgi:hypothetical protein
MPACLRPCSSATCSLAHTCTCVLCTAGNVYFTDSESHTIRMVTLAGNLVTVAGDGVAVSEP